MWTWLYDEKRVISASRPPRSRVIQPWISNKKTLPTPRTRRSAHNTLVLLNGEGRAPSQPPENPAGTKTWAAWSREHSNQQSPHGLQPEQLLRRFHRAYTPPLHPTTRTFTGNDLGHKPSAGAAGDPPEGEAQGIAKELAVLAGTGSRRWVGLDLDATTGQGDAGEQGGAGGVIGIGGDPTALGSRNLAVLEPICQGRDLGGDDVALGSNCYR
jgi:hypothetical protein